MNQQQYMQYMQQQQMMQQYMQQQMMMQAMMMQAQRQQQQAAMQQQQPQGLDIAKIVGGIKGLNKGFEKWGDLLNMGGGAPSAAEQVAFANSPAYDALTSGASMSDALAAGNMSMPNSEMMSINPDLVGPQMSVDPTAGASGYGNVIPGIATAVGGYNALRGIQEGNPVQAGLGGLGAGMGGAALAGVGSGLTGMASLGALGPWGLGVGALAAGLSALNQPERSNIEDKKLEQIKAHFEEQGLDPSVLTFYDQETGEYNIPDEERSRGEQASDLKAQGVPGDYTGFYDDPNTAMKETQFQNTKWLEGGNKGDLTPFDLYGYAEFVNRALQDYQPGMTKLDLVKRQIDLAEAAQKAGAVDEGLGSVSVDWDKVNQWQQANPGQTGQAWEDFKYATSLQSVQEQAAKQGISWQQEIQNRMSYEPEWTDWGRIQQELSQHYQGGEQQPLAPAPTPAPAPPNVGANATPMPRPTFPQPQAADQGAAWGAQPGQEVAPATQQLLAALGQAQQQAQQQQPQPQQQQQDPRAALQQLLSQYGG